MRLYSRNELMIDSKWLSITQLNFSFTRNVQVTRELSSTELFRELDYWWLYCL